MKNKIFKYDFLVVGAGLVGSLAAIALHQKKYKVLVNVVLVLRLICSRPLFDMSFNRQLMFC